MSQPCVINGWGSGPWGTGPWSGSLSASGGGPLPTQDPFDLFCIGPCGPMSVVTSYVGVDEVATGMQMSTVPVVLDLQMASGGTYPTDTTRLTFTTVVTSSFTLEFTAKFTDLPPNFSDLISQHIFVGTSDASDNSLGIFISAAGIAYTGAPHYDGSENLVINSTVQPIPGSQSFIIEDEYLTFRLVMDGENNAAYIYITKTAELALIGHQLRYVLPAIASSSCIVAPPDRTVVSVRGTVPQASIVQFDNMCLGSGLIIPNLPPVADPGVDIAARKCSIVQLDGTASYDPEGAVISYRWRLIDAPLGSQWAFEGADGSSTELPSPTGFTNKFRSDSLAEEHGIQAIPAGTVLVVGGEVYELTGLTGTDVDGFYFTLTEYTLPDNLGPTAAFKILYQNGVSGSDQKQPTFYPDEVGLYKFDLTVFDGALFSLPNTVIINVTESPVPRGCIPNVEFLWNYLSDFWRLVDGTEPVETFWSGLAQVAASELLTLWQLDYSKSLRDVQRTFQRRWLRYDLAIPEPLIELTTLRPLYSGVESNDLDVAGVSDLDGLELHLTSPILPDVVITATLSGDPLTAGDIANQLNTQLLAFDRRFILRVITNKAGTLQRFRIEAPFPFEVALSSQLPEDVLATGLKNEHPNGADGFNVGVNTFRVDRSLADLNLQQGDVLMLDGVGYRIQRVIDNASDDWPYQRVVTEDPLPIVTSSTWAIGSRITSKWIDFYSALVTTGDEATFEISSNLDASLTYVTSRVLGAVENSPSDLVVDLTPIGVYLADTNGYYNVHFSQVHRRKYMPIDPLVVDIPHLQEKINNQAVGSDSEILRRNIDFFLDTYRGVSCVRFAVNADTATADVWQGGTPPKRMWAELTYLNNNEMIEANFGIPAEFTLDDLAALPSNADYLSIVRGFWYSYFNGPTLYNLRVGTQILLGLPFAEEAGQIVEIRRDFSSKTGRILIRDTSAEEIVRSYTFPKSLDLEINPDTGAEYAVNDKVKQFAPLVKGAEVVDYIKEPEWFKGLLNQGLFFEVEKFYKFLVRVESAAFNLSSLLFVKNFILKIKPTYTYPLFVVLLRVRDTEISVSDTQLYYGRLHLTDGVCGNLYGMGFKFDEPDPSPGSSTSWMNQFDTDSDPNTALPTYNNPQPVAWGFDKIYLCPEDVITATVSTTFAVDTIPPFDSIFSFDGVVWTSKVGLFAESDIFGLAGHPTLMQIGETVVVSSASTATFVRIFYYGNAGNTDPSYSIVIKVNGVTVETLGLTVGSTTGHRYQDHAVSISLAEDDEVTVYLRPNTLGLHQPYFGSFAVIIGEGTTWAFDTTLPAATYFQYRIL